VNFQKGGKWRQSHYRVCDVKLLYSCKRKKVQFS